jgi:hypothetical protein
MSRPRPNRTSSSSAAPTDAPRASTRRKSAARQARALREDYFHLSTRPLHVLAFLAPLVVFYEIGSALYLTDPGLGVVETIRAQSILRGFFEAFDIAGLFLPGVALVTVLVIWHILLKDRWQIRLPVLAGMVVESAMWTLPLVVFSVILQRSIFPSVGLAGLQAAAAGGGASGGAGGDLMALSWQARLTISIGAGLYEELLFRMIVIAAVHLVLVDLAGVREMIGRAVAVGVSALAFALYHDIAAPGGGIDIGRFVFFLIAGLYFGGLFAVRGFGIVVAVHALYDALVLVFLRPG